MPLIVCQKTALKSFILSCRISKSIRDNRGWYICNENGGVHYLHNDGIIRNGVVDYDGVEGSGFWPTRKEATDFYQDWLVKYNDKMRAGGDTRLKKATEMLERVLVAYKQSSVDCPVMREIESFLEGEK